MDRSLKQENVGSGVRGTGKSVKGRGVLMYVGGSDKGKEGGTERQ